MDNDNIENYFPTGIVTGAAFCDREDERRYLKNQLEQNAHVVLMSPRRHGKSSLMAQFTLDQKMPSVSVDLLPATSGKYVKNAIIDGVTSLLDTIMPRLKKSKEKLLRCFSRMNPTIELSAFGQTIKLRPDEKTQEEVIMKLLMNLNNAATALDKKLIFVMDEFQQIATLEDAHSLEASIRHAVERSKNVFYVFSGSNRTLLDEMFNKKERPLYHLCDEMKLGRIANGLYMEFIQKAAQKNWGRKIKNDSVETILRMTECHPYYVNRICRILWNHKLPPTSNNVEMAWYQYVDSQKVDWGSDMISQLTLNQRTLLAGLAQAPEKEPKGKKFSNKLEMSAASIQRTLSTLLKKDYVYKDKNGLYQVLNPVIKTILQNDKYFDF